ncbi:hypothetical protein [Streptomyces sp. NPDC092370]
MARHRAHPAVPELRQQPVTTGDEPPGTAALGRVGGLDELGWHGLGG